MQMPFVIIALEQLVRTNIPHHDSAAAVLTLRNNALELEVIDRMVFSGHRQSFFTFRIRRALGDSPRFENIMHLQPEIVMKMTGCMFLDYKTPPASLTAPAHRQRCRFGSFGEIALRAVFCERTWRLPLQMLQDGGWKFLF